jgi:hypothetical protein
LALAFAGGPLTIVPRTAAGAVDASSARAGRPLATSSDNIAPVIVRLCAMRFLVFFQ